MKMTDWQKYVAEMTKKTLEKASSLFHREYTPRGLALLFLLAAALGFATKSLLRDSLTIGYDDYRLSDSRLTVDLNRLQQELLSRGGSLSTDEAPLPKGDSCSDTDVTK